MYKNEWMTAFYGYEWINIESADEIKYTDKDKKLYEWRIPANNFEEIIIAQSADFKLVETFIEFSSKVKPNEDTYHSIRFYESNDLEYIKSLNADVMCQSNGFRTRLNNLNYFDPADCTRYYNSAIVNYINELTVKTCVAELEGEIVGYYMLKQIEGNIYKGLMTGVLPKARGAFLQYKMQQFLINHIGHPITLINTTQLSNMAVIKNHIRSKRNLSKIEHIFYKKVGF